MNQAAAGSDLAREIAVATAKLGLCRTVVITGVSGGIGSATAAAFAGEGWRVVGLDRKHPDEDVVDRFIETDLSDVRAVLHTLEQLGEESRIDALVNNAASPMDKGFLDVTVDDWAITHDVNVRAAFLMSQRLLPALRNQRGAVVNVASVHALATSSGASAYAASKGALVALTRSIAVEMGPSGVRANAVLPGAVDTPMLRAGVVRQDPTADVEIALSTLAERTPLRSIGKPADIAQGILFLADGKRSGFLTGQVIVIDGGATARFSTE